MDYFIDVTLKPDAEMRVNVLLNKTYTKFHKVLHDCQNTAIGVSFPNYNLSLGNKIRLHGPASELQYFANGNWLGGFSGYCGLSAINPIPETIEGYRTVSRVQTTMSPAKFRRLIKRGSISENGAKEYKARMFARGLDNPYVELESTSNGHRHRRYIAFGELQEAPTEGIFDTFGLSKTATVPWF